jgi:hypothetical protein
MPSVGEWLWTKRSQRALKKSSIGAKAGILYLRRRWSRPDA